MLAFQLDPFQPCVEPALPPRNEGIEAMVIFLCSRADMLRVNYRCAR